MVEVIEANPRLRVRLRLDVLGWATARIGTTPATISNGHELSRIWPGAQRAASRVGLYSWMVYEVTARACSS